MHLMTKHAPVGGDEAASEDIEQLRWELVARIVGCFERLEDAVCELVALHSVDADDIFVRVQEAIDREKGFSGASPLPES
jgi:hypothetical protein